MATIAEYVGVFSPSCVYEVFQNGAAAQLYDPTGTSTLGSKFTTDAEGGATLYLPVGSYQVQLLTTSTGIVAAGSTVTIEVSQGPVNPAPLTEVGLASSALMLMGQGAPSNNGDGLNGDYFKDQLSGLVYGPKAGGAWPTGVPDIAGSFRESLLRPSGAIIETVPRAGGMVNSSITQTSGQLYLYALPLGSGTLVHTLSFATGTTPETTPQHAWCGLFDNTYHMLAVSADNTSTLAANTIQAFNVATVASGAASSFTTTYTGVHYIGIMVASGGTMPTMASSGSASSAIFTAAPPVVVVTTSTGLTTPPAFPFQATASASSTGLVYGFVS